ncbi:MAG: flagellar export chaperone FlgN [Bacteriovoracaceae bacterium]|nr:flagellar export chaperone FlgN [Bacteriovoracaceae bacterium]
MVANESKYSLLDYYHELTLIWRELCILHTQLFEVTNQEYEFLLSGVTEQLESNLALKRNIIDQIQEYDLKRQESVKNVFKNFASEEENFLHYTKLNKLFSENLNLSADHQLEKYNFFLIDIIEKIQIQNRKNRQFLNRSLIMLEDLKKDFQNTGKVLSYNKKGNLQRHTR